MTSRVLQRLRQGPLRLDDYAEVSTSRGSVKVMVHKLREQGHRIVSVEIPNGNRRPKVEYQLEASACPHCGQWMPSSSS